MRGRILYLQYTDPAGYPPLIHSAHLLADAGWQVLLLGTEAWGKKSPAFVFPAHPGVAVRLLSYCNPGWRQKLHYVLYGLWVLGWVLWWRPHWVYASDPLVCPVAWGLRRIFKVRTIYHEHDSPNPPVSRLGKELFLLWLRRRLAARAEICILPNTRRVERFASEVGRSSKTFCVWNCPSRREVGPLRSTYTTGEFWLVYQGSIVPPRLPLTVVEALTRLPEHVRLAIVGYERQGAPGYPKALQEWAADLELAPGRVEYWGSLPHGEQLLGAIRKGHVGLALMPRESRDVNLRHMVGASNKSFEYLACGLPVLVTDLPEWKRTFVDPGYGLACNPEEPESIAAALRWFLEHPAQMHAMGERGRQQVLKEWNYETQFSPVLELLERV